MPVALLSVAVRLHAETNSLPVVWTGNGGTNFILYVGTVSRDLSRSYTFTNEAAWITPDMLSYGDNYLSVASRWITPTSSVISDLSNEIVITRKPGLGLRLAVNVQASTNLAQWVGLTNFVIAVSSDQPSQFFRPSLEMLKPEPDTIAQQPPAP